MGFDYGNGQTNVSRTKLGTGERVRYGVISFHEVLQAWCDESEPFYGEPHCPHCGAELDSDVDDGYECECGHTIDWVGEECYGEPLSHFINSGGYEAESGDDGDIFITKSPYYTRCNFCSPCAPGAGYLMDRGDDCFAFCFGPDWFDGECPYPVYRVLDGCMIYDPEGDDD